MDIDLVRKDEIPQQFTSEEMTDIKNAISQETANVNIKPYHVYSPNEQVVGEWQEMRDGVLKKKPVYERCFSLDMNISANSWAATSYPIGDIDRFVGEASVILNADVPESYSCAAGRSGGAYVGLMCNSGGTAKSLTANYTKTTDEWENV